ncbi:class I SAM-dependent methyltransferase [Streptomyces mirabilis]|uniref:Class I SAM-dependent methyltransferase n=1 Tax=Streptomyces mirabilis TaxID=68239 RepID=A0ABU3UI08_9ACTN|nr:class I SAM-dependent methyltransferase [Streptomyces mirabilis]MCX4612741.1 methyltransferase domain-containing protein [Streptomyces mirabilis]MCX5352968.1 methyltransferase domain-containing protein [Streptomyces mirabilis]MDU8993556.1 class I SAM-dependent methyltransferase [Streptomyces mirabilis]
MTTDEDELYDADEDPYALALRSGRGPVYLRLVDGRRIRMPVHRWHEQPTVADKTVLERCIGPVLDVGCGPGRMCRALLSRGVFALGVDIAPRAVALTTAQGGLALRRSVFDRLPAERGWKTVLLIDGNIGIGGDPQGLLRRCGGLIAPTGCLVVEVELHDVEERYNARFENLQGQSGPFFPWARLGRRALNSIAADLALSVTDQWSSGDRCFATLAHQGSSFDCPDAGRR